TGRGEAARGAASWSPASVLSLAGRRLRAQRPRAGSAREATPSAREEERLSRWPRRGSRRLQAEPASPHLVPRAADEETLASQPWYRLCEIIGRSSAHARRSADDPRGLNPSPSANLLGSGGAFLRTM